MSKIKSAVIGLGYWGPNLARNFQASGDFELVGLCDWEAKRLERVGAGYPMAQTFTDLSELLSKARPELVAIATPVATHYSLVKASLEAGCHVLCEKPLAATAKEAEELVELAAKKGRSLFVDHTFTYTGSVRTIRDLYRAGGLGDLFYVDSVRINLGLFQPDVDVFWDLAPHDLSILNYVIGQKVVSVRAVGTCHNPRNFSDVGYLDLTYASGLTAHLHLSWLSPVKVRRMIFSGSKSSLIFDDLEMSEKIKIYDQGVSFDIADVEHRRQVLVNYRKGDMHAPAVGNGEALATELAEISGHIRGTTKAAAMGEDGLEIVRILEASTESLARDGARVPLA